MKKFILTLIFISPLILSSICKGQDQDEDDYIFKNVSQNDTIKDPDIIHFTVKDTIREDTLIDTVTGTKFIIDKKKIYITAVDKKGKVLWRTDPIVDNKLGWYRVKRPTFTCIILCPETVYVHYNNSQFGHLEKDTGKFSLIGQD